MLKFLAYLLGWFRVASGSMVDPDGRQGLDTGDAGPRIDPEG
jgi:hypothetical protein